MIDPDRDLSQGRRRNGSDRNPTLPATPHSSPGSLARSSVAGAVEVIDHSAGTQGRGMPHTRSGGLRMAVTADNSASRRSSRALPGGQNDAYRSEYAVKADGHPEISVKISNKL